MPLVRRRVSACPSPPLVTFCVTVAVLLAAVAPASAQIGTISGTVTDSVTGLPLGNIPVIFYNASGIASGGVVTSTVPGSVGTYSQAIPAGTYYLRTGLSIYVGSYPVYLDELYNGPLPTNGLPCWAEPQCSVTSGAPVTVASGLNTQNIDFALTEGGQIAGTISDSSGAPLTPGTGFGSGYGVTISNASGARVGGTRDYGAPAYGTKPLAPGVYFVKSENNLGYLDELYNGASPGLPCEPSCTITSGTPVQVFAGQTTANIDFALTLGGRISGTITDAAGSQPLAGVTVSIHSASGAFFTSAPATGPTGEYATSLFSPLPDGTYYVKTSNSLGYLDELYSDIPCSPWCTITSGTPVSITGGVAAPAAANFMLPSGARFTGTVTSTDGVPLGGVVVQVYSTAGAWVEGATSDAAGVYKTLTMAPGSYYVRTSNSTGWVDQLYQNVACAPPGCPFTEGTLATLSAPATTINFALAPGARLSGHVRDTAGNPQGSVNVQVYSSSGALLTGGQSAAGTGQYTTIASLAPGTYFVRTSSSGEYIDQLYQGITCEPTCTVTSGTPLVLAAGPNTLDFSLARGARISGTVTGSGAALSSVQVQVTAVSGTLTRTSATSSAGAYSVTGLLTGSYYVRTFNNQGFLDEVHNDVPCLACSPAAVGAAVINVTEGGSGDETVHFDLARGGQITGRVTDVATTSGVSNVSMSVFDASGRLLGGPASVVTNSLGSYATTGLPAGRYFIQATPGSTTNYVRAVYGIPTCLSCNITDGLPIEISAGTVTGGIDFALQTGGRISGSVAGGSPAGPLNVSVEFYSSSGTRMLIATSSPTTGLYTSNALPPGTYFALTRAVSSASASSQGFINEVFDDIRCSGCSPTTGAPITVTAGATTPNINFVLAQGGRISGQLIDESTSLPIQSAEVQVFGQSGLQAGFALTNASGNYTLPDGLAAGNYYARTSNGRGYVNRLYDVAAPCFPTCTPTSGTAIPVTASGITGNINFALAPGGRIAGTVTDAATGLPIPGAGIRVFDSLGTRVLGQTASAGGTYTTGPGLPAGDYYVATENAFEYINELHTGALCLGCNPAASGSPLAVTTGATASGVDFALDKGGRVAGTVTASSDSSPLKGVTVEVYASPFVLPALTATTDALGRYLTGGGLPDGTNYTVRTANSLGFINERWNNISCIDGCAPVPGDTITITAPATTPAIDFALDVDGDQDGDGIIGSIDTDKGAVSDGFTDLPQGGTTAGAVIARNGWTLSLGDLSSAGVTAELTGAGSAPAGLLTCPAGSAEEVWLNGAGARASLSCSVDSGSTTVRALAAFPYIELRKTIGALTTILELAPGQAATLGSPAVADPDNTEPVRIRLIDAASGAPIGAYSLDPGESAEAAQSSEGLISVTVFSGSVEVAVGEEVVTVRVGESHGFEVCAPLGIETLGATPALLWPPNHKMTTVMLSPTLSGSCGTATCEVVSVTSNEPVSGLGDGDTDPDWEIGAGLTLLLRAERSGTGSGRVYTVTIQCTDAAGNTVTKTTTVSVPHQR